MAAAAFSREHLQPARRFDTAELHGYIMRVVAIALCCSLRGRFSINRILQKSAGGFKEVGCRECFCKTKRVKKEFEPQAIASFQKLAKGERTPLKRQDFSDGGCRGPKWQRFPLLLGDGVVLRKAPEKASHPSMTKPDPSSLTASVIRDVSLFRRRVSLSFGSRRTLHRCDLVCQPLIG